MVIKRKKKVGRSLLILAVGLVVVVGISVWQWRWAARTFLSYVSRTGSLRSADNRVNVLILGVGGEDHAAGDLTDTMILASARLDGSDAVLITLPRDLWVPALRAKLNTVFHYQEAVTTEAKLQATKGVFTELLGVPIHYAVMINFQGFVELVDVVGGVDVEVQTEFDDYRFPIPGMEDAYPEDLRYEHLHFEQGVQHMDGMRALKFVRSRNAQGDEGTDFARSSRQVQFIKAVKEKILSPETLLRPQRLNHMMGMYGRFVTTDISSQEYLAFAQLLLKFDHQPLRSYSLDEGSEAEPGCLSHVTHDSRYDYQWVLVPRGGSWGEIRDCLEKVLQV